MRAALATLGIFTLMAILGAIETGITMLPSWAQTFIGAAMFIGFMIAGTKALIWITKELLNGEG
jgi:hypothetical protein